MVLNANLQSIVRGGVYEGEMIGESPLYITRKKKSVVSPEKL